MPKEKWRSVEGEQAILTGTREEAAPVKPRMEMAEDGTRGGCERGGMKGHLGVQLVAWVRVGMVESRAAPQVCSAQRVAQGEGLGLSTLLA